MFVDKIKKEEKVFSIALSIQSLQLCTASNRLNSISSFSYSVLKDLFGNVGKLYLVYIILFQYIRFLNNQVTFEVRSFVHMNFNDMLCITSRISWPQ